MFRDPLRIDFCWLCRFASYIQVSLFPRNFSTCLFSSRLLFLAKLAAIIPILGMCQESNSSIIHRFQNEASLRTVALCGVPSALWGSYSVQRIWKLNNTSDEAENLWQFIVLIKKINESNLPNYQAKQNIKINCLHIQSGYRWFAK